MIINFIFYDTPFKREDIFFLKLVFVEKAIIYWHTPVYWLKYNTHKPALTDRR